MHAAMASCSAVDLVGGRAWPRVANGESLARWQISLASRRPSPAMRRWSRRNAVEPHRVVVEDGRQLVGDRGRRRRARGPRRRLAGGSPATTHTPALRLGARLGEQQGPAVGEGPPGEPAPGLGRLLLVGLEPAALHEVDHEGRSPKSEQQVLAAAARRRSSGRPTAAAGIGRDGLQRGEGERPEPRELGPAERRLEALGVGLELGQLGHRSVLPRAAGQHVGQPGEQILVGEQRADVAADLELPAMKAAWALSRPGGRRACRRRSGR